MVGQINQMLTFRSLHKKIPNSKLVTVPQAGHLVTEERPEILVREIKDFLNQPNEI